MKEYNFAVVIGRFQPFHASHLKLVQKALSIADKVIIVIGSINTSNSIKNPFSYEQRVEMISAVFGQRVEGSHGYSYTNGDPTKIYYVPMRDYFYDDKLWQSELKHRVDSITNFSRSVALVGSYKDTSSYYLNLFPEWDVVQHRGDNLDATSIREQFYCTNDRTPLDKLLPEPVVNWLNHNYFGTEKFKSHSSEYTLLQQYKASWKDAPYPPIFVTVDTIVKCLGHVLLVKRKIPPGENLYALPGGFVKGSEYLVDGAIRELIEETSISTSKKELKCAITKSKVFDFPTRSLRGRVITHAYVIDLDKLWNLKSLPNIKANDDAADCMWISKYDISKYENEFFEDHFHILYWSLND